MHLSLKKGQLDFIFNEILFVKRFCNYYCGRNKYSILSVSATALTQGSEVITA